MAIKDDHHVMIFSKGVWNSEFRETVAIGSCFAFAIACMAFEAFPNKKGSVFVYTAGSKGIGHDVGTVSPLDMSAGAHLSCISSEFCFLSVNQTQSGNAAFGNVLSQVKFGFYSFGNPDITGLSCSSTSACIGVTKAGALIRFRGMQANLVGIDPDGFSGFATGVVKFRSVSCVPGGTCYALVAAGGGTFATSSIYRLTNAGMVPFGKFVPESGNYVGSGLICFATGCVVTAHRSTSVTSIGFSSSGGFSSFGAVLPDRVRSIGCVSASHCLIVGASTGEIFEVERSSPPTVISSSTSKVASASDSSSCPARQFFALVRSKDLSVGGSGFLGYDGKLAQAFCHEGWAVLQGFKIGYGSGFGIAIFRKTQERWKFQMFGDNSGAGPGYSYCSQFPSEARIALKAALCP